MRGALRLHLALDTSLVLRRDHHPLAALATSLEVLLGQNRQLSDKFLTYVRVTLLCTLSPIIQHFIL